MLFFHYAVCDWLFFQEEKPMVYCLFIYFYGSLNLYIFCLNSSPIINQVPLWVLEDRILNWYGDSNEMERVHFTVQILCFVSNNIYTCMTLDAPFRCVLFNMNHEMGPFQTERILFPGVVYIFYNPIFATFLFPKFQILYSLAGWVIRHGSFNSKRT